MSTQSGARPGLQRASILDTIAIVAEVVAPTLGKGVLARRPRMVGLSETLRLDDRAVRRMQRARAKYGSGPLLLAIPGRSQAVILSPGHVQRILRETPEPFTPASAEKRAALAHFEPKVSLVSRGQERADRRSFNGAVLEEERPVHSLAARFMAVVGDEIGLLLAKAGEELTWDGFTIAWHRIVRRVALGDGARDDHELTDLLSELRSAGNWAFLHPGRKGRKERFHASLAAHLARGEEGSLAAVIAALPGSKDVQATDQVAHYLFAFDPGGMAAFRALALLAVHPEAQARAREEIAARGERSDLPFLRACVLEALRLWPTTPVVLRETTRDMAWEGGAMGKHTSILIFAPFFHRDDENLAYAHRFAPELWLEGEPGGDWPLIPFSGGPGICPARNLVPMLTSAAVGRIVQARAVALTQPERVKPERLPGTLDNYTLRFSLRPLAG